MRSLVPDLDRHRRRPRRSASTTRSANRSGVRELGRLVDQVAGQRDRLGQSARPGRRPPRPRPASSGRPAPIDQRRRAVPDRSSVRNRRSGRRRARRPRPPPRPTRRAVRPLHRREQEARPSLLGRRPGRRRPLARRSDSAPGSPANIGAVPDPDQDDVRAAGRSPQPSRRPRPLEPSACGPLGSNEPWKVGKLHAELLDRNRVAAGRRRPSGPGCRLP